MDAPQDLNYDPSFLQLEPGIRAESCQFLKTCTTGHLLPEDLDFLRKRGCFHVPARGGSDRLITEYFRRLHPQLPILVEDAVWAVYHNSDFMASEHDTISLFVFQTMLFVASSVRFRAHWL